MGFPSGFKSFNMGGNNRNMGGTIRTVELMCGFKIKGDPGRLDLQLRLHKKKCEDCKNVTLLIKNIDIINDPANTFLCDNIPSKNLKRLVQTVYE